MDKWVKSMQFGKPKLFSAQSFVKVRRFVKFSMINRINQNKKKMPNAHNITLMENRSHPYICGSTLVKIRILFLSIIKIDWNFQGAFNT